MKLVELTLLEGTRMDREGWEVLGIGLSYPVESQGDRLIRQFGDPQMVAEMEKVFFAEGSDRFGHGYNRLMRGPGGRSDLQDVIDLLASQEHTKRALVTLSAEPNGKVPCINAIHFLIRNGTVEIFYFARGQDAFRKFYADGLCVAAMARKVAAALGRPTGKITGFIASSHVYDVDRAEAERVLAKAAGVLAGALIGGAA